MHIARHAQFNESEFLFSHFFLSLSDHSPSTASQSCNPFTTFPNISIIQDSDAAYLSINTLVSGAGFDSDALHSVFAHNLLNASPIQHFSNASSPTSRHPPPH